MIAGDVVAKPIDESDFVLLGEIPQAAPKVLHWPVDIFRRFVKSMERSIHNREQGAIIFKVKDEIKLCSNEDVDLRMVTHFTPLLMLLHFHPQWLSVRRFYLEEDTFPALRHLFVPMCEQDEDSQETVDYMEQQIHALKEKNWKSAQKISHFTKILNQSPDEQIFEAMTTQLKGFKADLCKGEQEQRVNELRLHVFRSGIINRQMNKTEFFQGLGVGVTASATSMTALPKLVPSIMKLPAEKPDDIYCLLMVVGLIGGIGLYFGIRGFVDWACRSNGKVTEVGARLTATVPETLDGIVDPKIPLACHFDTKSSTLTGTLLNKVALRGPSKQWGELFIKLGQEMRSYRFDFNQEWAIDLGDIWHLAEVMRDMLDARTLTPQECLTVMYYLRYGEIDGTDHKGFVKDEQMRVVFDIVMRHAVIKLSQTVDIEITGEVRKPFITEKEKLEQADKDYHEETKR